MEFLQPLVGPTDQPANPRIAVGPKAMTVAGSPGCCWHCCVAARMMDAQQDMVWVRLGHSWTIAE